MRQIDYENSAIGIRLRKFGLALKASPPFLSRAKQLIFLCGANQAANVPSVRRTVVKNFIQSISKSNTVIYAEGIFNELRKFGHQKNILDLEHQFSAIADKIIIILESESSFCELGAFAHEELRRKLIVINNSQFQNSESFINLGPIAAAVEVKSPVLWYPMKPTGVYTMDGIGAIFSQLKDALDHRSSIGQRVTYEDLYNADREHLDATKITLYFAHDLMLLTGPVTHEEFISILKILFGDRNFDIFKNLLGILREGQLLITKKVGDKWIYRAATTDFFLSYHFDVRSLMASFRTFHLQHNIERLYD